MARDDVMALDALQEEVIARYAPRLSAIIDDAMLQSATMYETTQEIWIPDELARDIEAALSELYAEITERVGDRFIDQFKAGFGHLVQKADNQPFYHRVWETFLRTFGAVRVAQIAETTREQIRTTVLDGLVSGDGVAEIANNIRSRAPRVAALRAAIIARTETHSAAVNASMEVAKTSSVPLVKEWASVEDSRTRDFGEGDGEVDEFNHRIMDGVQMPIDQPFRVPMKFGGTEPLMFPGDPNGSAGNIINCRCSLTYERAR